MLAVYTDLLNVLAVFMAPPRTRMPRTVRVPFAEGYSTRGKVERIKGLPST